MQIQQTSRVTIGEFSAASLFALSIAPFISWAWWDKIGDLCT